ncbi:MAG: metalloregulator ArsR/SmtB family transcription factor [Gammaproteobacteria bacterium]|nr:metalloregulator ArsR/SmtB family transcription factor [Rhodocyclaceae bacterium]MBU3908672.1 metalloregulator ArsR/SmtB family transcription factor [Gammaproteobacteria bacterium]MBU3988963.1 metalloregulator ArsR/SmtB family transcription factor [Gammaproteobacteria bacterium]MBU4004700.1 metalloregulator ArsR/SmtB family transcription factor [Gammaproteobacteria bacterium]MBU4021303.1 metalloregulator ArsR/SmtB family transcription factor [Gammaproteobacteria bacterium]
MHKRKIKDLLYEQVSFVGKALSSPKRLELLEVLVQGEKTVDTLAKDVDINIKLASSHLKVLKESRLIKSRREGKFTFYSLSGADVSRLWVSIYSVAAEYRLELQAVMEKIAAAPEKLTPETRQGLLDRAQHGDILVLDVRPAAEYEAGHLPHARSMPMQELEQRLAELPMDKEIVAYCRGPFCLFSNEAVDLLRKHGYRAEKIGDGVAEWAAAGLPLE